MRKLLIAIVVIAAAGVVAFIELHDGDREALGRLRDNVPGPRLTSRDLPLLGCRPTIAGCRSVRGRVVLVERVDPDGDGDLHVVIVGRGGVTAPGLSAIDIGPRLRPGRDPRLGDSVAAIGPVETGSHGQRQVAAVEFQVAPR